MSPQATIAGEDITTVEEQPEAAEVIRATTIALTIRAEELLAATAEVTTAAAAPVSWAKHSFR